MADQRPPISNILEGRKEARRERDRARRNSLTDEQKEEINARRRAKARAKRNSLAAEKKEEINARTRAAEQITEEKRARHRENTMARRNTPCAESIATPCPNATTLPTSTPEYTIRTDGNTLIFTNFIYVMTHKASYLWGCTYEVENVVGKMEAFLSNIMDENTIPDDLMDEECYMSSREGTYAAYQSALFYDYESM